MKLITKKIFSHRSISTNERYYVRAIRKSKPKKVNTFQDLVEYVAKITYENPDYSIYFRGQLKDYNNSSNETTLFPSIYRDKSRTMVIKKRTKDGRLRLSKTYKLNNEALYKAEEFLVNKFEENDIEGLQKLRKFKELSWAILQHYEVCTTPLLDITHSLRVAASFALLDNKNDGYLYLLGFPHVNGSISYFVEEELMYIKLLSTCPPTALRPYYQEGFLSGSFPIPLTYSYQYDFSRRLIAKFKLNKKKFWDDDFSPIPKTALYPDRNDSIKKICDEIKNEIPKSV